MNFNEKVNYYDLDRDEGGQSSLEFYSYIVDNKRKLVLNRFSYNSLISMRKNNRFSLYLPVNTFVSTEDSIKYLLENDLSISPEVYGVNIYFRAPSEVGQMYGEMIN